MSRTSLALLVGAALASVASAQWPTGPATNLALTTQTYEEAQPKLVAGPDGGFYVSWFGSDPAGSPAGGFDVFLQRLDVRGIPQWSPPVLVADRGFSSTQDYGLGVDSAGNALLAFRDDRVSGTQITAAKVDRAGAAQWTAGGVQLTSTGAFVAAPKIVGTTDGCAIVAWTQDDTVRLQKLDAAGTTQWVSDEVLSGSDQFLLSDLQADDAGGALVSTIVQASFLADKNLHVHRYDAAGTQLFSTPVYTAGSLQFGNFPTFVHDGAGGAVLAWYSVSGTVLEVHVQHVDGSGVEQYPSQGAIASTSLTSQRTGPALAYAPGANPIVFYPETNLTQSMSGISAQSFDASGNRLWGATGLTIVPQSSDDRGHVAAVPTAGGGAMAVWSDAPAFGQDTLESVVLDASGSVVAGPASAGTTPSTKFRTTGARSCLGYGAFVWQDERAGNADVYATNLNDDGSMGGISFPASSVVRNGSGVNPVVLSEVSPAVIGGVWQTQITLSPPYVATGLSIGLGGPLPGFPLAFGELLMLDPTIGPDIQFGAHAFPIPLNCGLVGATFPSQGVLIAVGPLQLQLTNAIDFTIGAH